MPTGSKYARGDQAWGLCQKCGLRFLLRTLVFDGYYPGLRVCVDCYDSRQPQEFLVDVTDPTALWKPSPEWGPENPQLSAVVFADEVVASWTECIPRGGSRVKAYMLYRSVSTDGVNFTASVQIANLPVVYYVDLADLVENGNPKFDNEGIELEFLTFTDTTLPSGIAWARYQVFAQMDSGRLANSNILTLPIISVGALGSIATAGSFLSGTLASFLPPDSNSLEDIQSAGDFISGSVSVVDPDFADVVLLLHFDGSFGDSSNIGNSMTPVGFAGPPIIPPPMIDTTAPMFGSGDGAFSIGRCTLSCPTGAPLDLDYTNDFTIEGWVRFTSAPLYGAVIADYSAGPTGGKWWIYVNGGGINFQYRTLTAGGTVYSAGALGAFVNGTYYAFAAVMHGGVMTMYLNGVLGALTATIPPGQTPALTSNLLTMGFSVFELSGAMNLDEVRITNGVARYLSNYTPTGPFPNS